jgi:hypothetical protein
MTIPFDCHFAQRIVGRSTPSDPLMQAPVPRSVGFSEPAVLWMVRAVGIEPTLLAERDFESRASTNSTTPALREAYSGPIKMCNVKSELLSLFRWFRDLLPCCDWRGPRFPNIDSRRVNIVL